MKSSKVMLSLGSMLTGAALVAGLTLVSSAQAHGNAPSSAVVVNDTRPQWTLGDLIGPLLGDPETGIFHWVYNQVNPSVVAITVRMPAQDNASIISPFGLQGQDPYTYAAGSGFVYDRDNHIVTNAHVVAGADRIEVTFSDGTMRRAQLVGLDTDSDIAVIKVEGNMSVYAPVPLANSDNVQVGDLAIAIGNPFERSGTMTHGIISGLHRSVTALTQTDQGGNYTIPDAIQTDAPINPGNSGGPLLNNQGAVIGVNEQIESSVRQSSGVGFAVPSNIVRQAVDALIRDGKVEHAWLGIAGTSLSLDLNNVLNLPDDTRGVYVSQVTADSPASKAGLKAGKRTARVNGSEIPVGGDVIIAIDGHPIKDFDGLTAYLFGHTQAGQAVTLTILRNGRSQQVSVTLQSRPRQD